MIEVESLFVNSSHCIFSIIKHSVTHCSELWLYQKLQGHWGSDLFIYEVEVSERLFPPHPFNPFHWADRENLRKIALGSHRLPSGSLQTQVRKTSFLTLSLMSSTKILFLHLGLCKVWKASCHLQKACEETEMTPSLPKSGAGFHCISRGWPHVVPWCGKRVLPSCCGSPRLNIKPPLLHHKDAVYQKE